MYFACIYWKGKPRWIKKITRKYNYQRNLNLAKQFIVCVVPSVLKINSHLTFTDSLDVAVQRVFLALPEES